MNLSFFSIAKIAFKPTHYLCSNIGFTTLTFLHKNLQIFSIHQISTSSFVIFLILQNFLMLYIPGKVCVFLLLRKYMHNRVVSAFKFLTSVYMLQPNISFIIMSVFIYLFIIYLLFTFLSSK